MASSDSPAWDEVPTRWSSAASQVRNWAERVIRRLAIEPPRKIATQFNAVVTAPNLPRQAGSRSFP